MSIQRFQGLRPASTLSAVIPSGEVRLSLPSPFTMVTTVGRRIAVLGTACVWLVTLATGCGGGGGGSGPTAPSIADIAGNWTGTYTTDAASGCGCVAELVQSTIGLPSALSMEVSQNGTTFEGRLTDEEGVWCDLEGTVGSQAFDAEFTACSEEDPGEVECLNGNRLYVAWGHTALQGNVIGNRITGTVLEDDECFNSDTGEYIGVLSVQLGIEMQRG